MTELSNFRILPPLTSIFCSFFIVWVFSKSSWLIMLLTDLFVLEVLPWEVRLSIVRVYKVAGECARHQILIWICKVFAGLLCVRLELIQAKLGPSSPVCWNNAVPEIDVILVKFLCEFDLQVMDFVLAEPAFAACGSLFFVIVSKRFQFLQL